MAKKKSPSDLYMEITDRCNGIAVLIMDRGVKIGTVVGRRIPSRNYSDGYELAMKVYGPGPEVIYSTAKCVGGSGYNKKHACVQELFSKVEADLERVLGVKFRNPDHSKWAGDSISWGNWAQEILRNAGFDVIEVAEGLY